MRDFLRAMALAVALMLIVASNASFAQQPKEVDLTAPHIQSFIATQKDKEFPAIVMKLMDSDSTNNQSVRAELDSITMKHGFKDYSEYADVVHTIGLVMSRIDPQTKALIDTETAIKKEIAQVAADKSIGADEKTQQLTELEEALKNVQPIQHPKNIELVVKYYAEIDAVM
jgi:hypothetical protein